MNTMTTQLLPQAAPVIPLTSNRVATEMLALVEEVGAYVDHRVTKTDKRLEGTLVMPYADLTLAGTGRDRPLLIPEGETLAALTYHDVLLLRHDPEHGTTFDVRLQRDGFWTFDRVAWQPVPGAGDLWLVPQVGFANCFRVTAAGLIHEELAPFFDMEDRKAGLRRTLKVPLAVMPAFVGSC